MKSLARKAQRSRISFANQTALIICNGEPPSRTLACRLARSAGYVVAADGGANIARFYGIRPDVIIGDLDSIKNSTRQFFSSSILLHFSRQDNTDLEKSLDFVVTRKIKKAIIIAATGKRLDFTLGNLSVLWNYTSVVDMEFVGDGWTAMPVGPGKTITAPRGTTVSLIPFGNCYGITLKGLQYPLTNASMTVGEIGVSNVVRSSPFSVRVRKGNMLLLMLQKTSRRSRSRRHHERG